MKLYKYAACLGLLLTSTTFYSCEKFYDVNDNPNNVKEAPLENILPAITVNVGYLGGSDLLRYSGLIMQQFSGQTVNPSQTFLLYERYNINNSDVNNQWSTIYANLLADIAKIITLAEKGGSPHYAGVAKLLKAYTYQLTVDAWGDVPFSEASQFTENLYPKYDDDEQIYKELIKVIDAGIADINSPTSALSPGLGSTTIYPTAWPSAKANWIKFANTLKLRIYLHYTQKDAAFATSQITALVNSGAQFMTSNADNFGMKFLSEAARQNPITSIEGGQFRNSFFPNRTIVDMMNAKADPRRPSYFVPFPYNSSPATYKGASALDANSVAYSRLNTFLKGDATINNVVVLSDGSITDGSITWSGNSSTKLLSFAEYNFIRAEAALNGAPGDAETFFKAGIRASLAESNVSAANADTYVAAHGTLTGTNAQKLEQIINEKFVANFGVVMEPWTDWRRTGYPRINPLPISMAAYDQIPRTIIYPLSETSSNPNAPARNNMLQRVFWDTRQ